MVKDLEVIESFLNYMEEATKKLERASLKNSLEESNKLKSTIIDLSKKISEELR